MILSEHGKTIDYSMTKRQNQPYIVNDCDETDTHYCTIKNRHRADIQRNNPSLPPSADEGLLAKRMAQSYWPYRASS